MAGSTFLIIGLAGLVLLGVSAFVGSDDIDVDADGSSGVGGGILEWFSIKGLSVAAVGFGFVGWATTANNATGGLVWTASLIIGVVLWALAVKMLFPWLKGQQGDDLQSLESYQGQTAEVVVRIPPNGVGTVQFTNSGGAVLRLEARSTNREQEVATGKRVLVVLSNAENVVVEELSFLDDTDNS